MWTILRDFQKGRVVGEQEIRGLVVSEEPQRETGQAS